jgi:CDP-paratose 2-epimerase
MDISEVPKKVLVTGSAGLIGSESVSFFCELGSEVVGIDNDMRSYFFGKDASTQWNNERLKQKYKNYAYVGADIRDNDRIAEVFQKNKFDLIIHTAAQPSHDWAAREPLTDFSVNAVGTLQMLEHFRHYCPEAVFIFTSTNKVYGDNPNRLPVEEHATRWELPKSHPFYEGIDESMSLDNCTHSIFGVSKASADLMVQEYGRYFHLNTVCFRGGCLTGASHAGAMLHGFLAYLIRCVAVGEKYSIFGYKGKQVRDNIHARDVVNVFYHVYRHPRSGEAYNLGGGRFSNISINEALEKAGKLLNKKAISEYVDEPRIGDHIWYISSMAKFEKHYPHWKREYDIDAIFEDIARHGNFK